MIGKTLLKPVALLAIVSAVASAGPARHYTSEVPSIVFAYNLLMDSSHHEKRVPQDDDEVYRIMCRMRSNCHPLSKPTSTTKNDKSAAKTTSKTRTDESVVDWVSILNAPGPVMTDIPSVMATTTITTTTTTTDVMAREISSKDSSTLETAVITTPAGKVSVTAVL